MKGVERVCRSLAIVSTLLLCSRAAAQTPAAPASPPAQPPVMVLTPPETGVWSFEASGISIGVNDAGGRDSQDAKFEEYREVPDGPFLEAFRLLFEDAKKGSKVDLRGVNAGRDDESYHLFARTGRFSAQAFFDRTPHLLTNNAATLYQSPSLGVLRVPDPVRAAFEALDNVTAGQPGADDPGIPVLGEGIAETLELKRLGYERRGGGGTVDLAFTDVWSGHVNFSRETRNGTKVVSAGSYDRQALGGSGAAHTGDFFRTPILEMPEPVDYQTTRVGAWTDFSGEKWVIDARADFSEFENDAPTLVFDNPFRITDLSSASFRQRFAQGLSVLPPDNQTVEVSLAGSVQLPARSFVNASLSTAEWRQDDAFAPYTLNSAISAAAGFDVTDPANLPERDLDGKVRINTANLVFTTRPVDPFTFTARFRRYDYNDRSRSITFPGYAAGSESTWRPLIETLTITNHLKDYTRTRYAAEAIYRPVSPLAFEVSYAYEKWDRENRTVDKNNEDIYGGAVQYRPSPAFSARVAYRHSERDAGPYHPELEFVELRDFDVAERTRDAFDAHLLWSPAGRWSFGANVTSTQDDYDETRYGRNDSDWWSGGLDVTYTSTAAFSVNAFYSRETLGQFIRSNAKDDRIGGTNYLPVNDWTDDIDDKVDVFGVAFFGTPAEKWNYDVRYSATLGRTSFEAANPQGSPKLTNAQAFPWPDIENRLHTVRADASYDLTKSLRVGLRYWYENFRLDDFMTDIVSPYMFDQVAGSRTDARRAFFLDDTYGDYSINVGTAYLRYVF